MRNCKWCGKEFEPGHYPKGGVRRTKLCPKCQAKIVTPKPRICKGCGKEFTLAGKKRYPRAYCDECLARFQREQQEREEPEKLQKEVPQHKKSWHNVMGEDAYTGFGDIFEAMFNPSRLSLKKKRMVYDALSNTCASQQQQIKQEEKRMLVEAAKKIDEGLKKHLDGLAAVANTGIPWDRLVYDVLLQGKAPKEDLGFLRHVQTSDGRIFGQCENCYKYVEEKKVGEGFDPSLHLCYDWENKRSVCPECLNPEALQSTLK